MFDSLSFDAIDYPPHNKHIRDSYWIKSIRHDASAQLNPIYPPFPDFTFVGFASLQENRG